MDCPLTGFDCLICEAVCRLRLDRATDDEVDRAAIKWCGSKEYETSLDDVEYFRCNWRSLPGLRAYVERELDATQ